MITVKSSCIESPASALARSEPEPSLSRIRVTLRGDSGDDDRDHDDAPVAKKAVERESDVADLPRRRARAAIAMRRRGETPPRRLGRVSLTSGVEDAEGGTCVNR
jgi:hypothetical protein